MKKVFLLSAAAFVFLTACQKTETVNQNTVVNSPTPANVETVNANSGTANTNRTATDSPVPTFTDEQSAIAEGNKFLDNNSTEKAIEAYNQAAKLNPESGEAFYRLGIAHLTLENEKEAAQINEDPEPTPAKGKAKSKKAAKNAIEMPDTEWVRSFEKAIKNYQVYVKKNPKDDVAFFNLGRSFNKLNKDQDAEKAFKEAVEIKPEDGEYQTEYGAILVKLAQYERAIPVLKKALRLDESNSQAQELLEKAEAGKKRIDFGAKEKAKQMASQAPPKQ